MKSYTAKNRILCFFIIVMLFCGAPLFAQDNQYEVIGRIVQAKGAVRAVSAQGDSRQLLRRSEIFAQDAIVTGADGFVQIRMVDSAIIALKENSEFIFNEYSFDGEGGAPDRALMELVRGGFRTIDGLISGEEEYRVDTQFASIGVRGTTHEAVIDEVLDVLFTGVYDGGTTVANADGVLELGLGANFDFSRTSRGQAPVGLLAIPLELGNININAGIGPEEEGSEENTDVNIPEEQAASATDNTLANESPEARAVLQRLSEDFENNPTLSDDLQNNQGLASRYPLYRTNTPVTPGEGGSEETGSVDNGNAVIVSVVTDRTGGNTIAVREPEGLNSANTNIDIQINPVNNLRDLEELTTEPEESEDAVGQEQNKEESTFTLVEDDSDDSGNSNNNGNGNGNNNGN